jgi:hypothetical protein
MILTIKTIGFMFLYLTYKVDYFSHLQLGLLQYSIYTADQLYDFQTMVFNTIANVIYIP